MKEFRLNYRPSESEENDVVDPWSEQPDGPFDHQRFETLTVLANTADQVMDRYAIKGFKGLTKRQADWACKLQSFFNLSNPLEALVLLLFTFRFSQNERFELEIGRTEPIDRSHPLSQALMAWVWWDPSSETSCVDQAYPWEYGEERTSRMVAIASGLLPEPIDVASPSNVPPYPPKTQ